MFQFDDHSKKINISNYEVKKTITENNVQQVKKNAAMFINNNSNIFKASSFIIKDEIMREQS